MDQRTTVAVIGLGAAGLVTLKNLLEEGFDATGFDRNGYVGGLWKYVDEDRTSVLGTTVVNISKERGCFTDFPFPKDVSSHPTSGEVQAYLESYCRHFNLEPRIQLNTAISRVLRDEEKKKWTLEIDGLSPKSFDKVVIANGINQLPKYPMISGIERFGGTCIHSRSFKKPDQFQGKKVLVVGLANTGADTATQLIGHADKIYISHRNGTYVIPRVIGGKPVDHSLTWRMATVLDMIEKWFPRQAENIINSYIKDLQDQTWTLRPEWKLSPAPSVAQVVPTVTDDLIAGLESGHIQSVAGIEEVVEHDKVKLTDGTLLDVDTIIWCTGYTTYYGLLERENDPTTHTTPQWAAAKGSSGKALPRLYRNIFSLEHPDSLAFMGMFTFSSPAFQAYDLATMAIAQVWKGNSSLPSMQEMTREVDKHHQWVCNLAQNGSVYAGIVPAAPWMEWANHTAGTGVIEHLGYNWKGWLFWLRNMSLCNRLMSGTYSPHTFRLFDGKRQKWDGALDAITDFHEAVKRGKTKDI